MKVGSINKHILALVRRDRARHPEDARNRRPALVGRPLAAANGRACPTPSSGPLSDVNTASVEPSSSVRMSPRPRPMPGPGVINQCTVLRRSWRRVGGAEVDGTGVDDRVVLGRVFDDVAAGPPEDAARPVARRPLTIEERRDGLYGKMRRVEPDVGKEALFLPADPRHRLVRRPLREVHGLGTGFICPGRIRATTRSGGCTCSRTCDRCGGQ